MLFVSPFGASKRVGWPHLILPWKNSLPVRGQQARAGEFAADRQQAVGLAQRGVDTREGFFAIAFTDPIEPGHDLCI